ncbi:MAG: Gfo/Idh/MocA family oxidoreductase [Armatimonadota bacterium]
MSGKITRRQFLATGAAVSAGLMLGGRLLADTKPVSKVRVGAVGVGARGTFLLDTMLAFPDVEVPAICDIDVNAAKYAQDLVEKKTGKRPTIYTKSETDWKNLCDRDDLDAVVSATPWEWHAPIAIAAMRAGKYIGTEVPACVTMKECWDLIRTSQETGMPCMMLENVNYFQNTLAVTRMIREDVIGEIQHAEAGYQHDCRFLAFKDDGQLTWRGKHMAEKNGNLYPTHPIGPVAWWMNINRGNRFIKLSSISTKSRALRDYAEKKFGADHPLAKREYALGDVNTTLIEVSNGMTITLYFDLCSPRPYDMIFRVQGTKGIYEGTHDRIHIEGVTPEGQWETFSTKYQDKYEHPIWRSLGDEAIKNGGHGGCDFIVVSEFLNAVRNRTQTPQDVYDAVTWSAIVPLTIESVSKHGKAIDFPDFTEGKWKTNRPV